MGTRQQVMAAATYKGYQKLLRRILSERSGASWRRVTNSVRYLLMEGHLSEAELAERMHASPGYFPRKVDDGRWKLDDLDKLSEIYHLHPSEFLLGAWYIKQRIETRALLAEIIAGRAEQPVYAEKSLKGKLNRKETRSNGGEVHSD